MVAARGTRSDLIPSHLIWEAEFVRNHLLSHARQLRSASPIGRRNPAQRLDLPVCSSRNIPTSHDPKPSSESLTSD